MSKPDLGDFHFLMTCDRCGGLWDLGTTPACTCPDANKWTPRPKGHPHWVSAMCWNGRHHRCTGWMAHGSENAALGFLYSVRCECQCCRHLPVSCDRHLWEAPQKGWAWN